MISLASAQTYDTVQWKTPRYHYSTWYDSCPDFFDSAVSLYHWPNMEPAMRTRWLDGIYKPDNYRVCLPQYVERPTQILGIAVAESIDWAETPFRESLDIVKKRYHLDEYAYLYQKEGKDEYRLVDSVRWDTVTKKIIKLALNADTVRFPHLLLYVYEAYFSTPQTVDSLFYLHVSNNSYLHGGDPGTHYEYNYMPTGPMGIFDHNIVHNPGICSLPSWYKLKLVDLLNGTWYPYSDASHPERESPIYGGMFPIVDYVMLSVSSHDETMGVAGPTAKVSRNMSHIITATPRPGHRFVKWNDGVTVNPRTVYITQDSAFTAHFAEDSTMVTVSTESIVHPVGAGYVEGAGTYYICDTVTLHAIATDIQPLHYPAVFSHWNDGVTVNPRTFIVTGDTSFTAYFVVDTTHDTTAIDPVGDAQPGLFTLTPNPATGSVTLQVKSEKLKDKSCTVTVLDASGHEVLRSTLNSQP